MIEAVVQYFLAGVPIWNFSFRTLVVRLTLSIHITQHQGKSGGSQFMSLHTFEHFGNTQFDIALPRIVPIVDTSRKKFALLPDFSRAIDADHVHKSRSRACKTKNVRIWAM